MSDKTGISWTDATWNPIRGCSRVSRGCEHCYAEVIAGRFGIPRRPDAYARRLPYQGLVRSTVDGPRWTSKVRFVESALGLPLRWKKPRRIFVNSMSDLFHEKVPDEWIGQIIDVMGSAPQHTFQILTKRPERMREFLTRNARSGGQLVTPLSNAWWGVSVEDQATADARIPLLLQTPAAVRWVSYEPALSGVDFSAWIKSTVAMVSTSGARASNEQTLEAISELVKVVTRRLKQSVDWLVVGGESGSGARPFDLAWARSAIGQCRAADVPCFVKQIGSNTIGSPDFEEYLRGESGADCLQDRLQAIGIRVDRKGADPTEWPLDLRVQEFPR